MKSFTQRLDKYLANRGLCARRAVAGVLQKKKVTVNGKRVLEPGVRINPSSDDIRVDSHKIKKPGFRYFLLNKPKGYISTSSDEFSRRDVVSLVKTDLRIYPVGRLDKDTHGLLILTNDGELTNLLTHPRFHIDKTYLLALAGAVDDVILEKLKNGVMLSDGMTYPAKIMVRKRSPQNTILEMTIHEGRNRQIRRMCEALRMNLVDLERIAIGGLKDDSLAPGKYRELAGGEVERLRKRVKTKEVLKRKTESS